MIARELDQWAERGYVALAFDAFPLVEELRTQPLQVVVGNRVGSFGAYRAGQAAIAYLGGLPQ